MQDPNVLPSSPSASNLRSRPVFLDQNELSISSLENLIVRRTSDIAQTKILSIQDAIMALQKSQAEPDEDIISSSLSTIASLARGNAEMRTTLRNSGACKLIASILHFNINSRKVSESALKSLCRLIKDGQGNSTSIIDNIDAFSSTDGCKDIITILYKHGAVPDIVLWVFISVCCLTINESKKSKFGAANACEAILEALNVHSDSMELSEMGCKALVALVTEYDDNKKKVSANGGIDLIVMTIRKHIDQVRVSEQGLWLIYHLSKVKQGGAGGFKAKFGAVGACDVIVEILQRHIDVIYISDLACLCITNLSCNYDANKVKFCNNGACEQLITLTKRHHDVNVVADHAMIAIATLCTINNTLKTKFGSIGACELAIDTMKKFIGDPVVACSCFEAIALLAAGNDTNKSKFSRIFDLLIEVIKRNITSPVVAANGCWAISALATLVSKSNDVTGISSQIMDVLKRHESSIGVAQYGCQAIVNLSIQDSNATILGNSGACERVIFAMKRHGDQPFVAAEAIKAVANLLLCSESNSPRFSNSTALETIIYTLHQYISNTKLTLLGCKLLFIAALNYQKSFIVKLGAAGVCELIIQILKTYPKHEEICRLCYTIIYNLSLNENNTNKLVSAGLCDLSIDILRKNIQSPIIVEPCCQILLSLSYHHTKHREKLGHSGACELTIELLKMYCDHETIIDLVSTIITNLCDVEANLIKFCNSPAVEYLYTILEHFDEKQNYSVTASVYATLVAVSNSNDIIINKLRVNGICGIILKTLLHHRNHDEAYIERYFMLTVNISTNETCSKALIDGGASTLLLEIAQFHIENQSLVIQGLKIFLNLCLLVDDSASRIGSNGGCEFVTVALKKHFEISNVAILIFAVISTLCKKDEGNVARFIVGGICDKLVASLRLYLEKNNITEHICRAIIVLASNDTRRTMLSVAGTCEAIAETAKKHINHPRVIEQCCRAIYNLSINHESNISKLGEAKVCEVVHKILNKHIDNPSILKQACKVVVSLAANNRNALILGDASVCPSISAIMGKYISEKGIVEHALHATLTLCLQNNLNTLRYSDSGLCETLVEAMGVYGSDCNMIEDICKLICLLSKDDLDNVAKLVSAGACECVVDAVVQFPDKPALIQSCCVCITNFLRQNEFSLARFSMKNIYHVIANILHSYMTSEATVENILVTLSALSEFSENGGGSSVVQYGICELLVECIGKYLANSNICTSGMRLMALICSYDQAALGKFGTPESCAIITNVIKNEFQNNETAENGTKVIRQLCEASDTYSSYFGTAGLCSVMVDLLRNSLEHAAQCDSCLITIFALVQASHNAELFVAAGVIQLVVETIRIHFSNIFIAERGCALLSCLPLDRDSTYLPYAGNAVEMSEVIVETMDRYSEIPSVTECGMRAMVNFSSSADRAAIMITAGGVDQTYKSMNQHVIISIIAEKGCQVINMLARSSQEIQKKFGVIGACELLVELLDKHSDVREVIKYCCEAIRILAQYKPNQNKLLATGVTDQLIDLIRVSINDDEVLEVLLDIIIEFALFNDSYSSKLGAIASCDNISTVLELHLANPAVIESCVAAVNALCLGHDANKGRLGNAGVCEHLVAILKKYLPLRNNGVIDAVCKAIATLATIDANRVKFGAAEVCPYIVTAMTKLGVDDPSIAESSCVAACKLCWKHEENKAAFHSAGVNKGIAELMQKHNGIPSVMEKTREALKLFVG